jgi:hypothetical protein
LHSLCDVGCHCDTDTPKQLNSFGDRVHEFYLLAVMLVEEQMELIEGGTRHLPMRLLVKVAEGHGVGQQLVELSGHFQTDRLLKCEWQQVAHCSVGLNLRRRLMKMRLCADIPGSALMGLFSGQRFSFTLFTRES